MPRQHVSNAQWRVIEPKLPRGTDRTHVRNQLELIAHDRSTFKQRADEQEEIARACDTLIRLPPREAQPEFVAELVRLRDAAKNQAAFYRRQKSPRLFRQWEILRLWQEIGGDLRYKTASRKPRGAATWPEPQGAVISFFGAAWKAVAGETLSAKTIRDIVVVYRKGMRELKAAKIAVNAEVVKPT